MKRVRWRYIIFHLHTTGSPSLEDVKKALKRSFRCLFGVYGLSLCQLKVISYDETSKLGVLKCPHKGVPMVRASIALLSDIAGNPSSIHVVAISGTLKRAMMRLNFASEKLKSHWREVEEGMKKPSQATE